MLSTFFGIGLGVLLLIGVIALVVIIAVATKRPGLAAIVGIVNLLGLGIVIIPVLFGSFLVTRSVSRSHVIHDDSIHTHTPQFVDMPPHSGGMSHSSWAFNIGHSRIELLIICVVAVGIAVAVASKGKHRTPGQRRGNWWPALLLVPLIAVPVLVVGSFVGYRSVGPTPVAAQEVAVVPVEALAVEAARVDAQSTEQLVRLESKRREKVKRLDELAAAEMRRAALIAQLQRQFLTMDFQQAVELFEAPKIELTPELAEAPAPPEPAIAPPSTPPPIPAIAAATAAEVTPDEVAATKITEAEKEVSTPAESSSIAREAAASAEAESSDSHGNNIGKSETRPLPEWVDDQPGMVGDDWREVVVTDEYATADECRQAMDIYLMLKTAERLQSLAGHTYVDRSRPSLTFDRDVVKADGNVILQRGRPVSYSQDDRLQLLQRMGIGIDEIRRSVVREEHLASRDSRRAFDTMYRKYTLAQFTPWFEGQLRRNTDSYRRIERFEMVGGGAVFVLGLLGLIFGLLKIDTWTRGYYSKRLFIGVPGAIIGFVFILIVWNEVIF